MQVPRKRGTFVVDDNDSHLLENISVNPFIVSLIQQNGRFESYRLQSMAEPCCTASNRTRPLKWRPAKVTRKRAERPRLQRTQEWESLYSIIRQLYVTEHRKLSEVTTAIERRHGFKATKQMYRKWITS
ncbi:hypothetical protein BJ170DRAFT_297656 [Xylariales sp. AK1849]|nr:hypothetical protein BJ170DRAFT_297656 [Xylariales sp. AK1849]